MPSSEPVQLHEETAVALEAGANPLAELGINGYLLGVQFINFALVVVVLWFLILKPLMQKMEERQLKISDSLSQAEEIKTQLQMSNVKYQQKIDEAKVEANKMLAGASAEAERHKQSLTKKAKQEIELLVAQAKRNIEIDTHAMREEIQEQAASLVVAVAEKVMEEKMDAKKDLQFVARLLNERKIK